ncbi:hypothetical protein FRC06_008873 [Ceratobasidium sp. 370]|nr:hypothetical protein FRC06_008873 [Ceratobasidium sp. 370]
MNFKSPFRQIFPFQSDPNVKSYLSPDGKVLAFVDTHGCVMLVDMQVGVTLGSLEFGHYPRITCFCWANNTQFIIGNSVGEVYQATLVQAGQLDSANLAVISTIIPQSNRPIVTLCHDPLRNLLAISFIGEIQIWCLRLDPARRRDWVLFDTIPCEHNGDESCATAMTFFGTGDETLCAVTHFGFAIWMHANKSLNWHAHNLETGIACCAVSPDGQSMTATTTNLSILIWPLRAGGPVISEQRTFDIPMGRDWQEYAESAPFAYFDAETIVTADPIGNVYALSLEGKTKHVFSVGQNYFIRSILACQSVVTIVEIGPTCTTLVIGYTNELVVHRRIARAWKAQSSRAPPRMITQGVTTTSPPANLPVASSTAKRAAKVPSEVADTAPEKHTRLKQSRSDKLFKFIWWLFAALTHYFCWRNLVASIIVMFCNSMLSLDFLTIYNVFYRS